MAPLKANAALEMRAEGGNANAGSGLFQTAGVPRARGASVMIKERRIAFGFDVRRVPFQLRRMSAKPNRVFLLSRLSSRAIVSIAILVTAMACSLPAVHGAESTSEPAWRPLPLIADGKVDPNWIHVGWGGFVVDDGALRTECDPKGLGLLVYKKERLGNCQVRVVFKSKEAKSDRKSTRLNSSH